MCSYELYKFKAPCRKSSWLFKLRKRPCKLEFELVACDLGVIIDRYIAENEI